MSKVEARELRKIFKSFVDKEDIRCRLDSLYEWKIFDWEKWLQVELAFHFYEAGWTAWDKEFSYFLDRRRSAHSRAKIDFVYQRPVSVSGNVAVELKVGRRPNECIKAMLLDFMKIKSLRPTEWEFQSVACIGFAPDEGGESNLLGKLRQIDGMYGFSFADRTCGAWRYLSLVWESSRPIQELMEGRDEFSRLVSQLKFIGL